MKKTFRHTIFYLLGLLCLSGCTRDDICTEDTPKTPLLIVVFYEYARPQFYKPVEDLAVFADTLSQPLFEIRTTDSIAIPLDTRFDQTDYRLLQYASDTLSNAFEHLRFSYNRYDEYVNRACAFRTNFYNLTVEHLTENHPETWIDSIHIRIDSISPQNQHEPHIRIYH